ncbi:conserved hypothetical protein [Crenothrix polyspora]|uniref:HNH endonuclease 5 domain-containing protein n=1 Tax=Crenothrix polyspora TaxID=360316 RepID=A0A1R4GZI9_9GAMM|nr:conserved hypothetical protein [Crenothrix polyspora]
MAILIKTRGPKRGVCNICGKYGSLSEDHTPPKGCMKATSKEIYGIHVHLQQKLPLSKGTISQNGVKYRTLCENCNNGLLGTEYDPSFISFVNDLALYLKTQFHISPAINIKTKPQRVIRSLLGHIDAQGVGRHEKGEITEPLKAYFLDPSQHLPDSLNIYCWPFPYKHHVMARDCAMGIFTDGPLEVFSIWFLKFFPVAFMVTFDKPETIKYDYMTCLSDYRRLGIDDEIEVTMNLDKIIHPWWPEIPDDNFVLLYGEQAITSFDARKRKK